MRKTAFSTDTLHLTDGDVIPLKVRSLVGLMPILAVETLEHDLVERLPVLSGGWTGLVAKLIQQSCGSTDHS